MLIGTSGKILGGRLMQLESVPALAAETCLQLCIMSGPFQGDVTGWKRAPRGATR